VNPAELLEPLAGPSQHPQELAFAGAGRLERIRTRFAGFPRRRRSGRPRAPWRFRRRRREISGDLTPRATLCRSRDRPNCEIPKRPPVRRGRETRPCGPSRSSQNRIAGPPPARR
jgi:hypothetical protein